MKINLFMVFLVLIIGVVFLFGCTAARETVAKEPVSITTDTKEPVSITTDTPTTEKSSSETLQEMAKINCDEIARKIDFVKIFTTACGEPYQLEHDFNGNIVNIKSYGFKISSIKNPVPGYKCSRDMETVRRAKDWKSNKDISNRAADTFTVGIHRGGGAEDARGRVEGHFRLSSILYEKGGTKFVSYPKKPEKFEENGVISMFEMNGKELSGTIINFEGSAIAAKSYYHVEVHSPRINSKDKSKCYTPESWREIAVTILNDIT